MTKAAKGASKAKGAASKVRAATTAPAPVVERPADPLGDLAREAGKRVEEARDFLWRFITDAKFRDETLAGAEEAGRLVETIAGVVAGATGDKFTAHVARMAGIYVRGAETIRRRRAGVGL